jgi:GT2 family glycosyltransferase
MDVPSTDRPKICAAILSYNRKPLLIKCLEAIKRQTRPVDHILVVDNHSSDGTVEHLRQHYPEIGVHPQSHNRGSAGGFSECLKLAHQQGYDWIWLLDDDVEVVPNAIEEMLKYTHLSKFIQGRRDGPNGITHLESFWDASAGTCLTMDSDLSFEDPDRDWMPVQWGCFEGPLIHRSIVERAGLPDERFFLTGDDMCYGLAASFHTTVIYIRFIVLIRQLPYPLTVSPMRWYFMVRNRFLIFEHLRSRGVPASRLSLRFSTLLLFFWCLRHAVLGNLSPNQRLASFKMLLLGLRDGWSGQFVRHPFLPAS